MKKIFFGLFLSFLFLNVLQAQEGMWMPNLLEQNEADMKTMGMQMSIDDIYHAKNPSIKDAIAIFGRGCTSEIVSPNGLLFTNHHCGFDAIQSLSSMEHNYLRDGFWAKSFAAEIPSPGLTATIINSITDVTDQVLNGLDKMMGMQDKQSMIDKRIAQIQKEAAVKGYQKALVKAFYMGNKYYLIIQTTYNDVRLVGTPPQSIGKFGADTDNWMWPRHTGDFSIFRIYADENNLPADYSVTNKPYKPRHYLPISIDGIEEGDFSLVYGFPYNTDEYLTSYAVETKMNLTNPARVKVREAALAVMDKEMRKNEATRLKYASSYAGIANYWKFAIGESKGLKQFNAVGAKEKLEKEFTDKIVLNRDLSAKYKDVLPELKAIYAETGKLREVQMYNSETFSRNITLPYVASILSQLENIYNNNGPEFYNQYKESYKGYFNYLYKDFDPYIDQKVFATLMKVYTDNVADKYISKELLEGIKKHGFDGLANEIYTNTILNDKDKVMALVNGDYKELEKALKKDKAFLLFKAQQDKMDETVNRPMSAVNNEVEELMTRYMAGQMEVFTDKKFYPDANGTLRVSYGKIKGYYPKDAVYYKPQTFLKGVMEKYKPGDYEFDVPEKLIELYESKNYEPYGEGDKMPVNFMATNHITGGNSGSPVLDEHGRLIGLAFDGVWEGTMGDIYYKPEVCLSIMVDIRYVLFIIDKFAGAQNLIDELTIVHNKK